ncbi:MAG: non-canonical purine NTP pyrophosphatase [Chloroflexi bacterium]|nr:non-canonical purine NTP pyrophosphatase [Chloroflexota bacterium]
MPFSELVARAHQAQDGTRRPTCLLATRNPAKQRELLPLLADVPVRWLTLADLPEAPEVAETGATFEENALLKARFYARWGGLPTLADDGGLEIDALGGEPGVRSRRWLGDPGADDQADDEALIAYTLERLRGVPPERRGAQFRVVLALAWPDGEHVLSSGAIRGVISEAPSPKRAPGFPYRAVFWLPEVGKFYLELSPDEHERLSHRRAAVAPIRARLRRRLRERSRSAL